MISSFAGECEAHRSLRPWVERPLQVWDELYSGVEEFHCHQFPGVFFRSEGKNRAGERLVCSVSVVMWMLVQTGVVN